ncbi:MAG: pitrilysin family protein [Pseudomonadota bacterium]|nr:pitrilysin family protein [Pseudomonadota bacterium]
MSVVMHTLRNGVRVVVAPMPGVETVSVGCWVDVGGRHERPEENGLAHMLEHMAFKGTESRSALRIAEEIEGVGGYLNAYTSREQTAYYARVLREDIDLAVELIADILLASTFPEDELAREREVIRQEIAQVRDTPDDLIFDNLQLAAYPDQAVGRSILGEPERVTQFARDDLGRFLGRGYVAPHMVVAAAGAVDPDAFMRQIERLFSTVRTAGTDPLESAVWRGGVIIDGRDIEQLHLALGFDGVGYHDPDYVASQVLSNVLGGGMSSRLFQEVRERRGLAYNVFSFAGSMIDGGMIGVYAAADPDAAAELGPVLCDEIRRVADDASEEETARARAQMKAGLVMSLESSSARLEQIARQVLLYGRPLQTADLLAEVDMVDAAVVRRVAGRLFTAPKTLAMAAVGPAERLASHGEFVRHLG